MTIPERADPSSRTGVLAASFAFVVWGFLPIYWKGLESVDSSLIICHRVIWSFLTLLPVIVFTGRLGGVLQAARNRKLLFGLACSGFLLAGNWFLFIWAVNSGMVLETSLGYFINPLLNILAGVVVFHEKASKVAWLAVALAAGGVLYQVLSVGYLPWVALALGSTFALYGLLRKVFLVEALPGLFIETAFVLPVALAYLFFEAEAGETVFLFNDAVLIVLLVLSGAATSLPLFLFAFGVRRIRMTTLGILQYISPSLSFLQGVFLFGEPFSFSRLITFVCIWFALAVYTWDSYRHRKDGAGR